MATSFTIAGGDAARQSGPEVVRQREEVLLPPSLHLPVSTTFKNIYFYNQNILSLKHVILDLTVVAKG